MAEVATGGRVDRIELDAYVVDTLMRDLVGHDRQPSAFLVYVHLWRRTGGGAEAVQASLQEIADVTGLSKRAVQDAIGRLHRRRLLSIQREGITAIPEYRVLRPWAERPNPEA
jgi:DNA-binding GntR family transcriptional regulator